MSRPDNLLFHSHIEICRILQVLAQERSPLSAQVGKGHLFKSQMLAVDAAGGHFSVTYGTDKSTNSMLLELPAVEFTAIDHQGLHFTFDASTPEETQAAGEPAIQFALPKMLLLHSRREYPHIPIPADISLRCVADAGGVLPFESHITDISHDGLGCLIYDPCVILEKGNILHGCRIIAPDGDVVVADLELRYATACPLPDGGIAHRAGFRFMQRPDGIPKLVGLFIQNLDKK